MTYSDGNFMPYHLTEEKAISRASCVINSWMDHGVHLLTDIAPEEFPIPKLVDVAKLVREALAAGAKGRGEILGFVHKNGHDPIKISWIAECSQYSGECLEPPENFSAWAASVREYHITKQKALLAYQIVEGQKRQENVDGLIAELSRVTAEGSKVGGTRKPFTFLRADQIEDGDEGPVDFVEGLLTEGGASVVYGPSNCGKSFWIVDLAAHVAAGKDWRDGDVEVDQGAVVYFALEGSIGSENRIKALRKQGRLGDADPFYISTEQVSLLEPGHSQRLADTVARIGEVAGMPVKLVIFDTLARAMAGGDENSGEDMTATIGTIDAVRAATGAHVCVVHHCGKDEARGARGHSSLRAAVDTEIEVTRPDGETISTARVTKQRDLQIGEPMPFSLEVVTLGTDRRGKPVTSCVVKHEDVIMAAEKGKAGRKQTHYPDEILCFLPQPSTSAWQRKVHEEAGIPRAAFYRLLGQIRGSKAHQREDGQWFKMEVSK